MLCFVFAALVVLLDQFIKHWIVIALPLNGDMDLIPGLVGLTHVENPGAAFTILADQRWLLAGIAFVAALVLIFILLRYNEGFWGTLGLAAVLGGAVGNLIDRVMNGYVVDMFVPLFINFAVFNVADIFITLGGITFCIFFIINSFRHPDRAGTSRDLAGVDLRRVHNETYEHADEQGYADPDISSDTKVVTRRYVPDYTEQAGNYSAGMVQEDIFDGEPAQEDYYDAVSEQQEYIEPASEPPAYRPPAAEPADEVFSTLDALGSLETELSKIDDYDVDALLREYGFED